MMEIPAGKWCYSRGKDMKLTGVGCVFACMYDTDVGAFNGCGHPDLDTDIAEDEAVRCPLRCPACLAAYPNGATIEIKPKGVK